MVIEKEFKCVNDPKYSSLDLWIDITAASKRSIELDITGLLNMQDESLSVTLSRKDALDLANTILNALKE